MTREYEIGDLKIVVDFENKKVFRLTEIVTVGADSKEEKPPKVVKTKTKNEDWRSKPRKCGNCKEYGHNWKTCTKSPKEKAPKEDDPAIATRVRELADAGLNITQIAREMKLPLEVVDKYW